MTGAILTLNAGSSSLKFAVFCGAETLTAMITGKIAGIGTAPRFFAKDAAGQRLDPGGLAQLATDCGHDAVIALLVPWLAQQLGDQKLAVVGHRVVHGGQFFTGPVRVTKAVLADLQTLAPLAPLHQPHNLAAMRAVAKWRPDLPQIACFDTSFHRTQSRVAELFALPRALSDEGVIRYGFHGLSYEYIAGALPAHLGDLAQGRVIVAHLGNGASMCAMRAGQSVATSMGFTVLDGLVMGNRCGALDPGVVLWLMQAKGMDAAAIEDLLYRQSGLMGVSGVSSDMQVLQDSTDPHAAEAIDLFCYRAASVLAGLVPAIGGLDALVFTAGIGENSGLIRRLICDRLAWLGITLDSAANEANAPRISLPGARPVVLVLPTNEEAVAAKACRRLMQQAPPPAD